MSLPWTKVSTAVLALLSSAACRDVHGVAQAAEEATTPAATTASVRLRGGGSTFVFPLMRRWVAEHPERATTAVTYQAIGSGAGVDGILARTLDFGATDSAMSDVELARARGPIVHVPIALGAVAVAYRLDGVPANLRLDRAALVAIFLGELTRWDDPRIAALNPGAALPATAITVVHRADASGTTAVFTRYLSDASEAWRRRFGDEWLVAFPVGLAARGNDGVAALIQRTPGAIGYVELTGAKHAGLGVALVENPAGAFVEPTVATLRAAAADAGDRMPHDLRVSIVDAPARDAYPIAAFTFALVEAGGDDARGAALARFLWWVVHDGQRLGDALFYAPLPPEVVARVERTLRSLPAAPRDLGAHP